MLTVGTSIVECLKKCCYLGLICRTHVTVESCLKYIGLPFWSDIMILIWSMYEFFNGLYRVLCIPLLPPLSRVKQSKMLTS